MVTTAEPLPGPTHHLSRRERADRTHELTWTAHLATDPAERRAAQEELVELNVRVARAVARRYRGRGVVLDDLEQVACEGLLKAIRRFDPAREHDLLSYAVPTIRGELLRYFRDVSWMIRPPRRVQELRARITTTGSAMALDLDREPTPAEVCTRLGIDRREHDEALGASAHPLSLDQPVGRSDATQTLGDHLTDVVDPYAAVEARVMLAPLLRRLAPRDRRILYLRYVEDRTQREIGEQLGVAQMQISRWLSRILTDLRTHLVEVPAPARPAGMAPQG